MKKNELVTGKVIELDFPNKGIVETEGGICVVKNTIPGQTVSFFVKKKRNGRYTGNLKEIEEASPMETAKACPHFRVCGGCSYQTLPIEAEEGLKGEQVKKLIENAAKGHEGCLARDWFEGVISSPNEYNYRNKMEFSFGDAVKGGELNLGMHVSGHFNDVVTVDGCNIADADFVSILKAVLTLARSEGISFRNKHTGEGYLRHLLVRKGQNTGQTLVDLVTTSKEPEGFLEKFTSCVLGIKNLKGEITGILNTVNDSAADAIIDEGTRVLYGQDFFYDEILGLKFKITAFSFFQTNTLGAGVLYSKVREYVADAHVGTLFDLYCGTGTIAQLMSKCADKVCGIELVEEAVGAARENAGLNNIENTVFLAGDVGKVLAGLDTKPDMFIVDPPREGVHPKTLASLLDYGVKKFIYVSCKITSLARDMEAILTAGYSLKKACCVNMFPKTSGIETVAVFEKVCYTQDIRV
ncbi:MAG: 23S rRNA (uracil(1939)-C(5))-methyltransferase RlmD [Lachnospiraceae bacterium]|nr:23S rRNA (uracil(1939)-C(5))-methyltransferase RlmD [Lachnospiraceae bacterium]